MLNSNDKNVLVIGASENPSRYAYKAIKLLRLHGYNVLALANKKGQIDDVVFYTETKLVEAFKIDTISLYINVEIQEIYKEFIVKLKPRRVIFNPGTENEDLYLALKNQNIEFEEACTLVLLNTNQF
jgi:uncharacterized protein